ncbi:MAG: ABC transporter permease [Candidatus Humimicrobiaceae bacterium]
MEETIKRKIPWGKIGLPLAIILVSVIFGIINPVFFSFGNLMNIGRQVAFLGLIAWGQTMVIIMAGIDLSVGSMAAFLSIVISLIIKHYSSSMSGVIIALVVAIIIGIIAGIIKGVLIEKFNLPAFITTLGLMTVFSGAALTLSSGSTIFGLKSDFFKWIGNGDVFRVPFSLIVMFIFLGITHFILKKTRLGVITYAVGGNERAAKWAGINILKYRIYVYAYSTAIAAIAAIFMTSRVNSGQPYLGGDIALQSIAAVCIGGTSLFGGVGSAVGTLLGVILIGVLSNGLNLMGVITYVQAIVIGLVILIAVYVSIVRRNK